MSEVPLYAGVSKLAVVVETRVGRDGAVMCLSLSLCLWGYNPVQDDRCDFTQSHGVVSPDCRSLHLALPLSHTLPGRPTTGLSLSLSLSLFRSLALALPLSLSLSGLTHTLPGRPHTLWQASRSLTHTPWQALSHTRTLSGRPTTG